MPEGRTMALLYIQPLPSGVGCTYPGTHSPREASLTRRPKLKRSAPSCDAHAGTHLLYVMRAHTHTFFSCNAGTCTRFFPAMRAHTHTFSSRDACTRAHMFPAMHTRALAAEACSVEARRGWQQAAYALPAMHMRAHVTEAHVASGHVHACVNSQTTFAHTRMHTCAPTQAGMCKRSVNRCGWLLLERSVRDTSICVQLLHAHPQRRRSNRHCCKPS